MFPEIRMLLWARNNSNISKINQAFTANNSRTITQQTMSSHFVKSELIKFSKTYIFTPFPHWKIDKNKSNKTSRERDK